MLFGIDYDGTLSRDPVLMPIVFAANMWKRDAALFTGYAVDVWIDDMTEGITDARVHMARVTLEPAVMDATDGPVCGCGRPSVYESGQCMVCAHHGGA